MSLNVHGRYQTVCQNRKRIGNSNTLSMNIQSGHRDRIWLRKTCHVNNEKRKTTHDGRNGTTKSGIIRTLEDKMYKYLGILETATIKQVKMKENIF